MKIIDPSFEILDIKSREDGINLLRRVEYMARISHRSEEKQTEDSWEKFLRFVLMQKGDWSVTEHCIVTVVARVDRGVTHEWVRHRMGSYTQESTRFVNYGGKDIEFVRPSFSGEPNLPEIWWRSAMVDAEMNYNQQIECGQSPQIARSVLPNATASTIAVTYNLRNWRQFFMSRISREAHPDFRLRISIPLLRKFQELIPVLYDDLIPEEKQSILFSRPR